MEWMVGITPVSPKKSLGLRTFPYISKTLRPILPRYQYSLGRTLLAFGTNFHSRKNGDICELRVCSGGIGADPSKIFSMGRLINKRILTPFPATASYGISLRRMNIHTYPILA